MSAHWHSNESQIFWCCNALLAWRELSHRTKIREVNGWRLSAIIHNLKTKYTWPILAEYRGPENVAYYRLAPGTDRAKLRFPPSAKALATEGGAA